MQEVFEEQHQHDVNTQHGRQHGQAKTGEQLGHDFSIADADLFDVGGHVDDGRQFVDQHGHIAQRQARQLNFKLHIARAVKAVNLGWAARQLQRGHLAEHDRTLGTWHHQALQRRQIASRIVGQAHNNRDLPL